MLTEIADAVRAGRVSPVELVTEALRRIERHDSAIGAVVRLRAEEALEEAEARHGRLDGPLAGVPLLVKDLARCAGMPTTFGSPWFADAAPDTVDDIGVARYKAAGAIVVGKTNTPSFGHNAVTTNNVFGPTRNPWNLERSPGGSSGGSGAALAAGLAPLATSSDGGGSVRIPASCCGLVGYKPTNGAIGRSILPRWITFSTLGATGHSVADVVVEASVLFGPVVGDLTSMPSAAISLQPTSPGRVIACRTLRKDVDAPVDAAMEAMCGSLADDLRLPLERVDAIWDIDVGMDWFLMAATELSQSLLPFEDRWDEMEPTLRMQADMGKATSASDYIAAQRRRFDACRQLDELLGDDGVLVLPTVNATSWPPEGPFPTKAGNTEDPSIAVNTPDFNVTGHPAVSVPLGHDDDGVPFGLQIVAPRCRDGLALGLAQQLEQARPWPETASGYEAFPSSF